MNDKEIIDMMTFAGLNWNVHSEFKDGFIFTIEEHCYTSYHEGGSWIVYDSEGDLPKEIERNLQALKYYFKLEMMKVNIEELLYGENTI